MDRNLAKTAYELIDWSLLNKRGHKQFTDYALKKIEPLANDNNMTSVQLFQWVNNLAVEMIEDDLD